MATHSSVLAWRIPGMGEPGGLPSLGSHRVGHDWSDLAAAKGQGVSLSKKYLNWEPKNEELNKRLKKGKSWSLVRESSEETKSSGKNTCKTVCNMTEFTSKDNTITFEPCRSEGRVGKNVLNLQSWKARWLLLVEMMNLI